MLQEDYWFLVHSEESTPGVGEVQRFACASGAGTALFDAVVTGVLVFDSESNHLRGRILKLAPLASSTAQVERQPLSVGAIVPAAYLGGFPQSFALSVKHHLGDSLRVILEESVPALLNLKHIDYLAAVCVAGGSTDEGGGGSSDPAVASRGCPPPMVIRFSQSGRGASGDQSKLRGNETSDAFLPLPAPAEVASLLRSMTGRWWGSWERSSERSPGPLPALRSDRALAIARLVGHQNTLAEACEVLAQELGPVLGSDRCHVVTAAESLHRRCGCGFDGEGGLRLDCAQSVAELVERSALPVLAKRASGIGQYGGSVDDPDGDGSESLLAVPIKDSTGAVLAVVIALRRSERAPLSLAELEEASRIAALVQSTFSQIYLQKGIESEPLEWLKRQAVEGPFRAEAIEAYISNRSKIGSFVRLPSRRLEVVLLLLLASALAAVGLLIVA